MSKAKELKTREELEKMTKSQLFRYADELDIVVPKTYKKDEIIDTILVQQSDESEPEQQQPDEQPESEPEDKAKNEGGELNLDGEKAAYVWECDKETNRLEHLVSRSAVEHARRDAECKSAKKTFESYRDQLSDHLVKGPQETLFDGLIDNNDEAIDKVCRICECTPSEKNFVADDLCWECSDQLGLKPSDGEGDDTAPKPDNVTGEEMDNFGEPEKKVSVRKIEALRT